jgi:DNA polymerase-1
LNPSSALLDRLGVTHEYITDPNEAAQVVAGLNDGLLGLDFETRPKPEFVSHKKAALSPHTGQIRLVQVWDGGQTAYVFDIDHAGLECLSGLWTHPCVAHEALFELSFLTALGVDDIKLGCAALMNQVLTGYHASLRELAQNVGGWELDKSQQKSDWSAPSLSEAQIAYAALDAVIVKEVAEHLLAELHKQKQSAVYRRLREVQPLVARLSLAGLSFRLRGWTPLCERWTQERDEALQVVEGFVGSLETHPTKTLQRWLEENLPAKALKTWPRTGNKKLLSVRHDDLKARVEAHPVVAALVDYNEKKSRLSKHEAYVERLRPETQRIYGSFRPGGARTGRFSCANVNLQNVPKTSAFRELFCAPEGQLFLRADFSQIELRVMALVSRDEAMLEVYRQGGDLHTRTAQAMTGRKEVTSTERTFAKPINFGIAYGSGAKTIAGNAKNTYGVEMTREEAKRYIERFFGAYPQFKQWRARTIELAKRSGQVSIPGGWVRYFAHEPSGFTETQAVNWPIQGGAAAVFLETLRHLEKHLEGLDWQLVNVVHDDLILEVAESDMRQAVSGVRQAMREGFLAVFPEGEDVTGGLAEIETGETWGTLEPFESDWTEAEVEEGNRLLPMNHG